MSFTPSSTPRRQRAVAYVSHLLTLNPDDASKKGSKDRQALAELRGALNGQPRDYLRAGKHVMGYLPEGESEDPANAFVEECFFQVGGLYAWGQGSIKHRQRASLGDALGELRRSGKGSDSLDGRFLALLGSGPDTLFSHLRQMIGLLRAAGSANLDWTQLLLDALNWNEEEKRVQRRWAKCYYRVPDAPASADTEDTDTGETDTRDAEAPA